MKNIDAQQKTFFLWNLLFQLHNLKLKMAKHCTHVALLDALIAKGIAMCGSE